MVFVVRLVRRKNRAKPGYTAIPAGLGAPDELEHTAVVRHTDSLEWMTREIDRHTARLSFLKTSSAARFLAFYALPWTVCNMQTIVMIGVAFVREIDLSGVTLELTEVSANGIAHGGAGP